MRIRVLAQITDDRRQQSASNEWLCTWSEDPSTIISAFFTGYPVLRAVAEAGEWKRLKNWLKNIFLHIIDGFLVYNVGVLMCWLNGHGIEFEIRLVMQDYVEGVPSFSQKP